MSRLSVKSVLCLMIGLLAQVGHAQLREFDITPVQSNRVPVFRDHPDMAAVIVNSSLPNLQFDSNLGIVAVLGDATQGEYILIVQPVRQIVTVRAQGYQQGRIPITLNQARQVAYFKVEPKDRVITDRGTLIVRTEPAGALVSIDGIPGEFRTPYTFDGILAITHTMRIRMDEYQTEERLVRVESGRPTVESAQLVPNFGFLLIREPDLELFLKTPDDPQEFRVSYTPGQPLKRPIGAYTYRLTKAFHLPTSDTVSIRPNQVREVRPVFTQNYATYRFGAMPRGEVRVTAGVQNAPAPSRPNEIHLQPGVHEVVLASAGYAPQRVRIVARSGVIRDTSVVLTGLGDLQMISDVAGGTVRLSNGMTSSLPARFENIPAGPYTAAVSAPFHATDSLRFDVVPFQLNTQTVSLRPQFATLTVRSNAPGLRLSVTDNRAPQSPTPGLIYLEPGQRDVLVEAAGYAPVRLMIRSIAGAKIDTLVNLLTQDQAGEQAYRLSLPRGVLQLAADVDAEIYVNGRREGTRQTTLTLVPGDYDVEFRHPLKTERLRVNVPSADLVQRQVLLRPDKSTAMMRAAMVPGLGHLYTKQSRGYAYMAGTLAGFAFIYLQNSQAATFEADHDRLFAQYQTANSIESAASFRKQAEDARLSANTATNLMMVGWVAVAGVYAAQLVDLNRSRPKYGFRSSQRPLDVSLAPTGVHLTYRFP